MFKALVDDTADFVRLFLNKGVQLGEFLTDKRQWDLYSEVGDVLAHARTHTHVRTHTHTHKRTIPLVYKNKLSLFLQKL